MVYTDNDEYSAHRGYDDFDDFKNDNTIPTGSGLTEIRKRSNAVVNFAYHAQETDSTENTIILGQYEMLVMDRMVQNAHKMDNLQDMVGTYLTEEEFKFLRGMGGSFDFSILKGRSTDSPFARRGWLI